MGVVSDEPQILKALDWFRSAPPNLKPPRTLRDAARKFNVSKSTLARRNAGGKSRNEAREAQFLLLPSEERVLEEAVLGHADRGFPVRIWQLERWALAIVQSRKPSITKLGCHWYKRFLERHPEVRLRWRQTMDRVRIKAADPASIEAFYELVCHLYIDVHRSHTPCPLASVSY
jgi:hypothetical protein